MSILKPASKDAATSAVMIEPEQLIEQLRVISAQIPEFVQLPNDREMKQMRRIASLNVEFAREAVTVVGASDLVQQAVGNTPAELYQAEDVAARWMAVETEIRAILRGVTAANIVRRYRIGLAAIQAFNVSRQLVRQDDHAHLLPHVEIMSRMPKYGRRRVKAAAAAQPPAKPAV